MAAAGGPVNISPREGPTHHPRTSMDEAVKKAVLRRFPYGLYAVTVAHGGEEHGMTANWVTQASFEPPMVVVAVENTSKTIDLIRDAHHFGVNVLHEGQRELAGKLGRSSANTPQKLKGIKTKPTPVSGAPILTEALGWLECRVVATMPSGDHTLVLAEVVEAGVERGGAALTLQAARFKYSGGIKCGMWSAECGMSERSSCGTTLHCNSAFRIPRSALFVIHNLPAHDRVAHPRPVERVGRYGEQVTIDHDQVGVITRGERPPFPLVEGRVGVPLRVGPKRLPDRDLLLGHPAVRVLAVEGAAGPPGTNAQDGSERRDGPVRPEAELRSGVEQRAERVGGLDADRSNAPLDPAAVVDRVVGLHRRNHAQAAEAGDVLRPQVLRGLDPEAPVARPVDPGDAVVDIEDDGVRPVADGVHGDLH